MTKARTKAQRRRMQKLASDHDLPPTPRRQGRCFAQRTRQQPEADPRETALAARCRRLCMADTPENRAALSLPAFSDPAGEAIYVNARDAIRYRLHERDADPMQEAAQLWQCFAGLCRVTATYHKRILGQSLHPASAKLEMLPERFETSAADDGAGDPRTADERDHAAIASYRAWLVHLGKLHEDARASIWSAVYREHELLRRGELTRRGRDFCAAIRSLRNGMG